MRKTLTGVLCSALMLSTGLFVDVSQAQPDGTGLVDERWLVTTHIDCNFNEAAGTNANDAAIDCGPFTGNQIWFNPFGRQTDGLGHMLIPAAGCGDPNGSYIRSHGGAWLGIDQTALTNIVVFEAIVKYPPGGDQSDNAHTRGGLFAKDLGTNDWAHTGSVWIGTGNAGNYDAGFSNCCWDGWDGVAPPPTVQADNNFSVGEWVFQGQESNPPIPYVNDVYAGLRIILDPTEDGPEGTGFMRRRFEVNPDVYGQPWLGWMEIVPVDSPPPPVTGEQLRSQSRSAGASDPPPGGDHLHPQLGNWDCDGIDLLVDRVRVFEVSKFVPAELSDFVVE